MNPEPNRPGPTSGPIPDFFSEQQRIWRRLSNVPHLLGAAWNTPVGTTASDVVLERPAFRLLRYRRQTPATHAEPVLFCYALINRPYILDLQSDKSVVGQYLRRGFDVYLIDWKPPSHADRGLTLEDYVSRFLGESVEHVAREHGRKDLHLLGYCMGGTLSVLFASLNPAPVKTLTLLATPIDFQAPPVRQSLLNIWADRRYFDVDAFIDAHGNCPAWFLQACFLQLKPVQSFLEKQLGFLDQMEDPRAISAFFAMERWINDNVPVAGETFREFVKRLYQANELVDGRFRLGGRPTDLRQISCPLLLLTASKDHLVAPSSTEGIRPHVRSGDVTSLTVEAGHVGLVVGGRAQNGLWPQATAWLAERSTRKRAESPPQE